MFMQRYSTIFLLLVNACLTAAILNAAQPVSVQLAKDKRALLEVTVPAEASAAVKNSATELAKYLSQISGAEFKSTTGDGSSGIVVGRASDFSKLPFEVKFEADPFNREEYLLRTHGANVYVLGATDLAVSHGVWDLLYRLGYRQFFPGTTWEIIPQSEDLKIALDSRESPSFYARRIWYNWGMWGYNEEPYRQWCMRNRAVRGFELNSGHAYGNIIADNRAEFDKHPEYFAQVNGQRKFINDDTKFCVSNPDLRKLVVEYAIKSVKKNPKLDSISLDPSDGGNWCECDACMKMGSVSDRVLTLANEAAEAINTLNLGPKYVGMYAYNRHCAPPTITAHPNVIVSATTAFLTGGYTFDQVVNGWKAKGARIGVYDYLSVVDWDWNLPRGAKACRPAAVAESLVKFNGMGAKFYDAESGDCWGPCGLGYYVASRVLWNLNEAKSVPALVDDFLEKCFGSAKEPMREFYRLITEDTQRRSPSDLVGRMYRHLDAARRATTDEKILQRINDLVLYTRYSELYYAHANGGSKEAVSAHAYRMRKTMMVHSYGLWARLQSQKAAATPNHPLKNEAPFTAEEISKFITDGIAKNQPVDPGFSSVAFSRNLLPAAEKLKLPKVAPGNFPGAAQDHQHFYLWVPAGAGSVDLTITVQKVWANRMPKVSLFSPQEVSLNAVATFDAYKPDGKPYEVKLATPYAGLHRIETVDGGDYTRIKWPAGMPVTVESGIETPNVLSHFRGAWTLYFYVPKGTKLVGGWASRIANWAPKISGKLLDGSGKEVYDFSKTEDGWFKIPVPDGEDGKLWKFENTNGQRLLMTVPPFLARSGEELLLPAEVIDADAKP
ncbi:MAG TPA: DUF4838 domain-containing protein [Planctomycetota bacterium]|nr:DUF4838 domain-containing protein [Planctomycetota bacterium]